MSDLSFTQEYYLCAVNSKGNSPLDGGEFTACLVVGDIMEMLGQGLISKDEKSRFYAAKPWDDSLPYAKPMYDAIASSKKPRSASDFLFELSFKQISSLSSSIGTSLVAAGDADELDNQGLFKNKTKYVPKPEAVTRVIEKVRAEFLEDGRMSDETVCLTALLDAGNLIHHYFSEVEARSVKNRLAEIRESETYSAVKEILDTITALIIIITVH
ncbi:MAG: GPP34 family phosphoprotein [Propionibacteriaceae bacterium]|nr:GPP34 family phosphoprotein [Propionibacteriaceae bacterium]